MRCCSHAGEKLDDSHQFRDEQRIAHKRADRAVARRIDIGHEDILDVDHADHIIEALAVNRQAAVAGIRKRADQVVEADARRHGHDVPAGDADVTGSLLAEVKNVAEHLPFGGRQVASDLTRFLGLVDRLFDLLAKSRLRVFAEDQLAHTSPEARSAVILARGHQAGTS